MRGASCVFPVVLLLTVAVGDAAVAQMFGPRALGRPITGRTRRPAPSLGTTEGVGQIQGTERFYRGNRSARDFVGTDARDRTTFVGQQAAEMQGPVVSAVRDLRPPREVNLNRAATESRGRQMYRPRLRINFTFGAPTNRQLSERIARQFERTERLGTSGPIEVSVAGDTATLRGTVASSRDRELMELVVRFEPGISEVKNELVVEEVPPPIPPAGSPKPADAPGQPEPATTTAQPGTDSALDAP